MQKMRTARIDRRRSGEVRQAHQKHNENWKDRYSHFFGAQTDSIIALSAIGRGARLNRPQGTTITSPRLRRIL